MADNKNFLNDDQLDQFLDNALANYSNVQPRAGLEDRILAKLDRSSDSAQAETRSWLRWWPALSFAGAAVFALLIFAFAMPRTTPKPPQVAVLTPATVSAPIVANPTSPLPRAASAKHLRTHAPGRATRQSFPPAPASPQLAVVKQDVFPAPSPLTDQERLLFSYMRRTPASEIAANAKPDPPPLEQINQNFPGQRTTDSNTNTR